jgi:hypothetical protein
MSAGDDEDGFQQDKDVPAAAIVAPRRYLARFGLHDWRGGLPAGEARFTKDRRLCDSETCRRSTQSHC